MRASKKKSTMLLEEDDEDVSFFKGRLSKMNTNEGNSDLKNRSQYLSTAMLK